MKVSTHCCVGGKNVEKDIKMLNHDIHVLSGTSGRFFDMI